MDFASVSTPFELRYAAVQAFLAESQGYMYLRPFPGGEAELWDANKGVEIRCDEVESVPSDKIKLQLPADSLSPFTGLPLTANGIYFGEDGSMVIHIEQSKEGWELGSRFWTRGFYCNFTMPSLLESRVRGMELISAYKTLGSWFVNPYVFAPDFRGDISQGFENADEYYITFLKTK